MNRFHKAAGLPRLLLSVVVAASLIAGCARPTPTPPPPQVKASPPADMDAWLKYMTVEEKVGQLFWIGLPGPRLGSKTEALIRQGKAGGVIYFARQGSDPGALRELSSGIQGAASGRDRFTPGLFISVDQEGGLVERFGPPFTSWPGNMAIGATRSEAYAEQSGEAIARELRAVGINMDLAPVADVNNNPENPVIGIRSFGEDPQLVARLVTASVKGLQSQNVSAVGKHFPGHGDTNLDSHKALPTVSHPWERLDKVELVPFRSAMAAGIDAVMTAHVIFPAVATDGLPATLSPKVLQDLLRTKMGYQGLIVTDAMDAMKAITDNYGLEQGLIMAVQAGADAVLVTESYEIQEALHTLLVKAVQEGKITEARLNDAVRHNLTLKQKRGLLPGAGTPAAALPPVTDIGMEANKQLALKIGADALTLVRNGHLPLKLAADQQVLVLGPAYAAGVSDGGQGVSTALGQGIRQYHENVWEVTLDRKPGAAAIANARSFAAKAAVVVYGVYNGQNYPEHQAFLKELIATGKPVIVVGMGEPYELTKLPMIQDYIAAYGFETPNLRGVGALLFGKSQPKGKLPVTIPGLYPVGHGLAY